jgi:RNA exonuclease 1
MADSKASSGKKNKKYKLCAADGERKTCAFFRDSVCRNGDKCPFLHESVTAKIEKPPPPPPPLPPKEARPTKLKAEAKNKKVAAAAEVVAENSSKVSKKKKRKAKDISSSDDDSSDDSNAVRASASAKVEEHCVFWQKGKCRNGDECAFAHVAGPTRKPREKKAKTKELAVEKTQETKTKALSERKRAQSVVTPSTTSSLPVQAKKEKKRSQSVSNGAISSLLAGLPVKPFVADSAADAAAAPAPARIAHPLADEWDELVALTQQHPNFQALYGEVERESNGRLATVQAHACRKDCENDTLPQVIAIDCEMCMSEDPKSGEKNGKELVRLSLVGITKDFVFDTLVRPLHPIVDLRTGIHGVTMEHLETVEFTAKHAQDAMLALCCPETVIIGHALHNDLAALRLSHAKVVDTALIFGVKDEPGKIPALRDVAKGLLGVDVQDGAHDSVEDARTALAVAQYAQARLLAGEDLPDVVRTRTKGKYDQLLVHRIPAGMTSEQLAEMFSEKANVLPKQVEDIVYAEGENAYGKAMVIFSSAGHARLAFASIEGEARPDATNRLQKRVFLQDKKHYLQVRKMHSERRDSRAGTAGSTGAGATGAVGEEEVPGGAVSSDDGSSSSSS